MFGTSYSGFNSLQLAADGAPELGAVVAIYATDDRYTDDVHYIGGVLRAIDLVDYVLYMVADERAAAGAGAVGRRRGEDEWRRRVDETQPWLLDWLATRATGRCGAAGRSGSDPAARATSGSTCPTMIVAGWADGYRNNTFRTVERLRRAVAAARRAVEPQGPGPAPGPARTSTSSPR